MATYLMFGRSSLEAMTGGVSAERTANAIAAIGAAGGELKAAYVLLGEPTAVLVLDLPGMKEAMQISMELTKQLGFLFTTAPAVTVEEFHKMFEEG